MGNSVILETAKSMKKPEIAVKATYFLLLVVHAKVSCVGYLATQLFRRTSSEEDFEFVRLFISEKSSGSKAYY